MALSEKLAAYAFSEEFGYAILSRDRITEICRLLAAAAANAAQMV